MKYTLVFALVALLSTPALSQQDSGIFLTVPCGKKSPKETVALTQKTVCLASNPMILTSEFQAVKEVRQLNEKIFFDLTLSRKAVETLNRLAANLPSASFALVVDKDVFFVFSASALAGNNSTLRFEGGMKDQQIFFSTQEKLKALINGGSQ
ncbi:MAG TPA: hypothetical protein VFE50_24240 [Cyclobacteriaceae bacterium]|nr:hypothetical protein [Cyclobacteriaceae bacterium]